MTTLCCCFGVIKAKRLFAARVQRQYAVLLSFWGPAMVGFGLCGFALICSP
jgi:hypothetical protein